MHTATGTAILQGLLQHPTLLDFLPRDLDLGGKLNNWLDLLKRCWSTSGELTILALQATAQQGGKVTQEEIEPWIETLDKTQHTYNYVDELVKAAQETEYRNLLTTNCRTAIEMMAEQNVSSHQAASYLYLKLQELSGKSAHSVETADTLISAVISEYQKIVQDSNYLSGISWGYPALNSFTNGLVPGDLIVIAARPSVGKTTMALNIARLNKLPTLFFSLEMTPTQLMSRILDAECGYPIKDRLRKQKIGPLVPLMEIKKCKDWNLHISNNIPPTPDQLLYIAARYKTTHDIKLVVIDYLQLMRLPSFNRNTLTRDRELAIISNTLKEIARSCEVPVIVISQLNRKIESRGTNSRPVLSDLRDSGAIEQDSDVIVFLMQEKQNTLRAIVGKNRNGPLGETLLKYDRTCSKIDPFPT